MRRFSLLAFLLLLLCPGAALAEDIVIGGLFAESGPVAFVGTPSRLVAEMAVEDINASGGVLGKKLRLVTLDTESDPQKALLGARQLVEQDKVLAIVGPTSTGGGLAVKKYTEEAKVPVLMTVGGDPVIAGGKFGPFDWTFKVPQRTSTAVKKVYAWLKAKGVTKIALLTATDGFGKDGQTHLRELAPAYGLTIAAEETLDSKGTDFSAQAFKLALEKPQAVVVWSVGPAGAIAAKNFGNLPGERPLVVMSHSEPGPKFVELAGAAAEGVVMPGTKLMLAGFTATNDPQKPMLTRFVNDYRQRGLEEKFPMNTHSGYAYDAMLLLKDALERAGKADREALRAALEKSSGVIGVSGVFTMSPEDHNGLTEDSLVMLSVKNGKFVPAN